MPNDLAQQEVMESVISRADLAYDDMKQEEADEQAMAFERWHVKANRYDLVGKVDSHKGFMGGIEYQKRLDEQELMEARDMIAHLERELARKQ